MDPITLAIVAALAGGALSGAVTPPFADAYNGLKGLIQRRFGNTEVPQAIESLEKKPDSDARKGVLGEAVKDAGLDQDPEIKALAEKLLEQIKAQPGGNQTIQQAIGSYIAQADRGSTASVNVNQPRE